MSTKSKSLKSKDLTVNDLTGVQKAELLMIALNVETASLLFKQLDR
jgi:flagellar motor switch protein FliG